MPCQAPALSGPGRPSVRRPCTTTWVTPHRCRRRCCCSALVGRRHTGAGGGPAGALRGGAGRRGPPRAAGPPAEALLGAQLAAALAGELRAARCRHRCGGLAFVPDLSQKGTCCTPPQCSACSALAGSPVADTAGCTALCCKPRLCIASGCAALPCSGYTAVQQSARECSQSKTMAVIAQEFCVSWTS